MILTTNDRIPRPVAQMHGSRRTCILQLAATIAGGSGNDEDAPKAGIKASVLLVRADHLFGSRPDDRTCSAGVVVGEDATGARWYAVKRHVGICVRPRDRTAAASAPQIG